MRITSRFIAIFAAVQFFVTASAHAYQPTTQAECSALDLRDVFHQKVRDQGGVSWCYAHSSADNLQYFFKIPEQLSAADIAIQYNLRNWPQLVSLLHPTEPPQTGFAKTAMEDELESGYCPEEIFPSENWTLETAQGNHTSVALLDAFTDIKSLKDGVQSGAFKTAADLPYSLYFQTITKQDFYEILLTSTDKTLLNNLRLKVCETYRKPFPSKPAVTMNWKGPNTMAEINAVLNSNKPVSMDYLSAYLYHVGDYAHNLNNLHTSLIMARKYDSASQQCQYFVRNTRGTSCEGYDPSLPCEQGGLWVPENLIYQYLVSFVYL